LYFWNKKKALLLYYPNRKSLWTGMASI